VADLVVVVGIVAFFAICVLLVRACDWIIGADPAPEDVSTTADAEYEEPMDSRVGRSEVTR
jgi:hypothetical protein